MKGVQLRSYYPVFLNVSDRKCVVVGGGQVALRKVKMLLEHGANVEVISPDLCPGLDKLAENGKIKALQRRYQIGDLRGAFMAIAATNDNATNQEVVKEARRGHILVNVVDDVEDSNFIVPSYLRRGDVTIAISTAGLSPALARKIRAKLEGEFGDEYASLAVLIDEVRSEIKREGIKVRGNNWHKALDLDLMIDLLKRGDKERAKAVLRDNLKAPQR